MPNDIIIPKGLQAFTIVTSEQAADMKFLERPLKIGDIIFVAPNPEGFYFIQEGRRTKTVGTLHGYYRPTESNP